MANEMGIVNGAYCIVLQQNSYYSCGLARSYDVNTASAHAA